MLDRVLLVICLCVSLWAAVSARRAAVSARCVASRGAAAAAAPPLGEWAIPVSSSDEGGGEPPPAASAASAEPVHALRVVPVTMSDYSSSHLGESVMVDGVMVSVGGPTVWGVVERIDWHRRHVVIGCPATLGITHLVGRDENYSRDRANAEE